ncbi:PHP domain-containing protein [Salinispira pacifica]
MSSTKESAISDDTVERLNAPSRDERLSALRELASGRDNPFEGAPRTEEVNNHVHTIYSFSPYSPVLAATLARTSGLQAVGSVDHDSISAAREMVEACSIIGMGSTVGCELRVNFTGTPVEGRKLNNPDSVNIAYMVIHGVPSAGIDELAAFLEPIHQARNRRNRRQVERLNEILDTAGVERLDFERDVYDASCAREGGSITERHILAALSRRILAMEPAGQGLISTLEERFDVGVPERIRGYLCDSANPHLVYDLLGVLKSSFLDRIFIQPDEEECIPVGEAVAFANRIGAIPAYAYLGDVGESPTGDKRAEKFEDDYLDELFPVLKDIGYRSVTYMPPRNSVEQLLRVQELCRRYSLLEISGVDINSSRQSFRCEEVMRPEFAHLNETTWALIAHEKLSGADARYGLFAADNPVASLPLAERVRRYAAAGRAMDPHLPESIASRIRLITQE